MEYGQSKRFLKFIGIIFDEGYQVDCYEKATNQLPNASGSVPVEKELVLFMESTNRFVLVGGIASVLTR